MQNLSLAIFIGCITFSDAVRINKDKKAPVKEKTEEEYRYEQFGKGMPKFWDDYHRDAFFADTWRHTGYEGHIVQVANDTAYVEDSPADYHFPTGVSQWEPTDAASVQLESTIEDLGMTAVPSDEVMV